MTRDSNICSLANYAAIKHFIEAQGLCLFAPIECVYNLLMGRNVAVPPMFLRTQQV